MSHMVQLVGEQLIPNLLPVLHAAPDEVLLLYTDRTQAQSVRLRDHLSRQRTVDELLVSAFDIARVRADLGTRLAQKGWRGPQTVFNLTGGTKTMAFAAYELSVRLGSDFFYLQSEGGRSLIYRYVTSGGAPTLAGLPEVIGPVLTVEDYVRAQVGTYQVDGYSRSEGGKFEQAVHEALCAYVDEAVPGVRLGGAVEIDMVIRCGNQVGIAEIKTGKPSKDAIGQLTTAGGRAYLGTYTRRFLITSRSWQALTDLVDLAKARDIKIIELTDYAATGTLSQRDLQTLQQAVTEALPC